MGDSDVLDVTTCYRPLGMVMYRNERVRVALDSYACLCAPDGTNLAVGVDGTCWVMNGPALLVNLPRPNPPAKPESN